jgi:hypothetical protein
MQRKSLVLFLVILILGFAAGYILHGPAHPSSASTNATDNLPVADAIPGYTTGEPVENNIGVAAGWCCAAAGKSCEETPGALVCLRGGGIVYDGDHSRCDSICSAAGKL